MPAPFCSYTYTRVREEPVAVDEKTRSRLGRTELKYQARNRLRGEHTECRGRCLANIGMAGDRHILNGAIFTKGA